MVFRHFYDERLLPHLCNFEQERKDIEANGCCNLRVVVRFVLFLLTIPLVPAWYYVYPHYPFENYFSNWGVLLSATSFLLYSVIPMLKEWKSYPNLLALAHVVTIISMVSQLIIFCIYWTLMNSEEFFIGRNELQKKFNVYCHTVPQAATLLNFLITDYLVYRRHVWPLQTVLVIFMASNAYETLSTGHATYFFLTWKDITTVYVIAAFVLTIALIIYGLANLSELLKGRTLPTES